ncbi:hypothetical protein MFIFM68171_03664 [Madurella fahalii]|uniref:Uncharacterized protein n=1 Tax=Madurella fahalii TaxID=1157608 RepID=A0ABQ0G716_9PEZI
MEGASTVTSDCRCYFDTADIKQGRWREEPALCIQRCRAQFLQSLSSDWEEHSGWPNGCRSLNRAMSIREFWSLYWCDSTFCGVGINRTGGVGQDPNVDLIINTCQNIGFYSIFDPGPPPLDFKCNTEADEAQECSHGLFTRDTDTGKAHADCDADAFSINNTWGKLTGVC